jgi:hypothetical protein
MSALTPAVAEIQGLYGPFSFPEKLLQKIWLNGDFDRAALATTDGRRVAVTHPGKWNLLGGPDFKGARLKIGDGPEFSCDVELHLHAADWAAHGHAADRAYDGVGLHVVLFPPAAGQVTRADDGRTIPTVALLTCLRHDLEEFAAEDAVEALTGRTQARIAPELAVLGLAELDALLAAHAAKRWGQKVHFAALRVKRLGWTEACHHAALEILGYRFNRSAMLQVAVRWPFPRWADGVVAPGEVFAAVAQDGGWSVQGVRPANHPRTRLRQYAEWVRNSPEWPERLASIAGGLPEIGEIAVTREVRRVHRFGVWRERFAGEVCGGALGGTRLDNMVCDGFLPLLAAHGASDGNAAGLWRHWFPGDLPPVLVKSLRGLGVFHAPTRPAAHGAAQGLLGWMIERDGRR